MRYSVLLARLTQSQAYAVLPEQYKKRFFGTRVGLWTLARNFPEERDQRELGSVFPSLEKHSLLLKIGETSSLSMASNMLARARERTSSPGIRQLFLIPPKGGRRC